MKILILLALLVSTASTFAKSSSLEQMLDINGHKLFVEHYPAAPGRPTLFLANGLTFSTEDYHNFASSLREMDPGVGLVLWDMDGMGRTLLARAPVTYNIPIEHQVEDLHALKQVLGITGPAALAGLSYGGALALKYALTYPDDFDQFIPIAPMLERLQAQDTWITNLANWHIMYATMFPVNFDYFMINLRYYCLQNMLTWHSWFFPSDTRTRAELTEYYQEILHSMDWWQETTRGHVLPNPNDFEAVYDFYLRILIYSTYWIPEPGVLENPYKLEGVFRMVQGVKSWNAFDTAKNLPTGKIHAIAAYDDDFVKIDRMELFWSKVPKAKRASFLKVKASRHKVTSEWPRQSAAWILQILKGNPDLNRGFTFEGNPLKGEAVHGPIRIPLTNKEGNCESLLRTVP